MCREENISEGLRLIISQPLAEFCKQGWMNDADEPLWEAWAVWLTQKSIGKETYRKAGTSQKVRRETSGQRRRTLPSQDFGEEEKRQ